MSADPTRTERSQAWGLPAVERSTAHCKITAAAVLVGPALVFGAIGYLFWGVGGLVPAAVALLVAYLILKTATSALVSSLSPRVATDPRLVNIVGGLSSDLGVEAPDAFVVEAAGINALVFRHRGKPAIGITHGAVTELARTELEAVVAHCLARLDGETGIDGISLALGGTLSPCAVAVTERDDVRAATITRYPPALGKAIARATPAAGRFAYLWFVGENTFGSSREERIAALAEL